MVVPDYIQVALDAIEEEDSFALEAEHQLVEWLEKIESGYDLNSINTFRSESGSITGPWSWSESKSRYGSWSRSRSRSRSRFRSWSRSGSWSWSRSKTKSRSWSGSNYS